MMLISQSALEVYEKAIRMKEEWSPQSRKKNRPQNIRVVIKNQSLGKALNQIKCKSRAQITTPALSRRSEDFNALDGATWQQRPSISRSSSDFQSSSPLKMSDSQVSPLKRHDGLLKQSQSVQQIIQKRQLQEIQEQIEFKHQQNIRLRQSKTREAQRQKLFIASCNREKIEMMRQQRDYRCKAETNAIRDGYHQTERNHQWIELKTLSARIQKNIDHTYRTSVAKNQQIPKRVYESLASMLAINPIEIHLPIKRDERKNGPQCKAFKIKKMNRKGAGDDVEVRECLTETNDRRVGVQDTGRNQQVAVQLLNCL